MSIQLHPRTRVTNQARVAIAASVLAAVKQYDLTYAEILYILADETHSWASSALRQAREENP